MENKQPVTIGVDVSKDTLEAALLFTDNSFAEQQFSSDAQGIKQLLSWATEHGAQQCRLCVEATGGFELDLCMESYDQHPITIVPPVQVASYRKTLGMRNKTDGVDAQLIARFAFAVGDIQDWEQPTEAVFALRDTLKWRRQLTKSHTQLSNCAKTLRSMQLKKKAAAELAHLQKQIHECDALLYEIIAEDEQLTQQYQLLCSITGIGTQTAATLCAAFDDNTFQHPKQLAAYIGITPMRKQSGNYEAKAHISKIGDAHLRTALFMAALSARVHNPIVRAFADQLSRRRPDLTKKQVIVACAHKLTRIIYGILKHKKPFDPNYCCVSAS